MSNENFFHFVLEKLILLFALRVTFCSCSQSIQTREHGLLKIIIVVVVVCHAYDGLSLEKMMREEEVRKEATSGVGEG